MAFFGQKKANTYILKLFQTPQMFGLLKQHQEGEPSTSEIS
jgi:hypothetical protein